MVVFNPVLLDITLFKTQQRPYRIAYPFGVAKSLQMIMRRFWKVDSGAHGVEYSMRWDRNSQNSLFASRD